MLRGVDEINNYVLEAIDGEIGHVEDFLVDDLVWTLNYIVVDTRNWLPGRRVLVPPQWADSVGWSERKVIFKKIRRSPQSRQLFRALFPNRLYLNR